LGGSFSGYPPYSYVALSGLVFFGLFFKGLKPLAIYFALTGLWFVLLVARLLLRPFRALYIFLLFNEGFTLGCSIAPFQGLAH